MAPSELVGVLTWSCDKEHIRNSKPEFPCIQVIPLFPAWSERRKKISWFLSNVISCSCPLVRNVSPLPLNSLDNSHITLVVQSIYDIAYIDLEEIVNKGFMAFFGRSLIGEAPQKSLPKSAYLKSGYNCYRYTPLSCGWRGFLVRISDNKFQVNVPFSA